MANKDARSILYNGETEVVFKSGAHRYYVDGKVKKGVTTVLDKTLSKSGLMLWAMEMALKYLEDRLPVITLVDLTEARKAHAIRRDAGADTGTIVHDLAERILRGATVTGAGHSAEVALAIGSFIDWYNGSQPEVLAVEQVVYSRELDYAGTFDSILRMDGKVYLCDLKTTNASREAPEGVYASYFIQLGAYAQAYEEQRLYEEAHGGSNLYPIDDTAIISCKKNGAMHIKTGSEVGLGVEDCKQLWKEVYHLWQILDTTKKSLGGR